MGRGYDGNGTIRGQFGLINVHNLWHADYANVNSTDSKGFFVIILNNLFESAL